MNFCPSCNNSLKIECKNCFEITYKDLNYCIKCGHDIQEKKVKMKRDIIIIGGGIIGLTTAYFYKKLEEK